MQHRGLGRARLRDFLTALAAATYLGLASLDVTSSAPPSLALSPAGSVCSPVTWLLPRSGPVTACAYCLVAWGWSPPRSRYLPQWAPA